MVFKSRVDAAQHCLQWDTGIFPSFHQCPIESGKQQRSSPAPLKMLFDFGEVVEVVFHGGLMGAWFASGRLGRRELTSGFRRHVTLPDNAQAFQRQKLIDL